MLTQKGEKGKGKGEVIKYEVRSTKCEVKELGATELRGWMDERKAETIGVRWRNGGS